MNIYNYNNEMTDDEQLEFIKGIIYKKWQTKNPTLSWMGFFYL